MAAIVSQDGTVYKNRQEYNKAIEARRERTRKVFDELQYTYDCFTR